MATRDDVLAQVLGRVEDDTLRERLHEALSREYSYLSEIGHRIFELAAELDALEADDLGTAGSDVVAGEVRRCEVALVRLATALDELVERLDMPGA